VKLPAFIEAQLPPDTRHAMVPAGREQIHVMEWGPLDGRPVLLVHGNPTWGFLWRKVAVSVLARDRSLRLIAPDLVGLGLSSRPAASEHTLAHHGAWLGAVIDQLIDRPLVLVAQDWGGAVGLRALVDRPSRLAGMVLANTAVGPPAKTFKPTLFHRLSQLPIVSDALFRGLGFPLGMLHRTQGDPSSIRGDVARAYRWPLRTIRSRTAPLALARMVPDSHHHPSIPDLERTDALYRSARVPIALVWGMKDPILGRVVGHLSRLRPDASVVKTGAGHFLQEEVPDELATAILGVAR
jgi:haloalkane dehalogenase